MKTPLDPRHQRRKVCVQALFAWGFNDTKTPNPLATEVISNQEKIDKMIMLCAPEWPLSQINRLDLAILRLAVYEMIIDKSQPLKVVIDEAVELAKEFGSESSPSFVNGCLGAVLKHLEKEKNGSE
jgi:transcription antitermination protein NusB